MDNVQPIPDDFERLVERMKAELVDYGKLCEGYIAYIQALEKHRDKMEATVSEVIEFMRVINERASAERSDEWWQRGIPPEDFDL